MKSLLTILGIFISFCAFTQQLFSPTLQNNNASYSINSVDNSVQYELWPESENYAASSASAAADVVLWSDDFANGLNGNNSSSTPNWTIGGTNGDIWEYDTDGSNGVFSAQFTLDSETKDNGWMIFDVDKSNGNIPTSAYQPKSGELISPIIDLSQDSNVTLSFTQAYRYCCNPNHKLKVYVYDGTNWNNGYEVNIGGSVNAAPETKVVKVNITADAALKSNVQIKFVWEPNNAVDYYWMIDDVKIIETKAYDGNLLGAFYVTPGVFFGGTSFRLMNLEQAEQTSYYFAGALQNSGYSNIDSARIYANIVGETGTYQSNGLVSQPTDIDTLYSKNGFTPNSEGVYISNVFAGNDDNLFYTDTNQLRFEITKYEYGKDNGNSNQGSFGLYPVNRDGKYEIGNRFMIHKSADIQAVKIRLDSRTGPDAKGSIRIYEYSNGGRNFVFESQEENIGQSAGNWYNFKFNSVYPLVENMQYLVVLFSKAATSTTTDTVFISTGGNVSPQESFIQDIDGVGENVSPGTWFYLTSAPCLRLNFEKVIQINENSNLETFSVHPNPSKGIFNINIQTKSTEDLQLNITNLLGQRIYTESLSDVNKLNKEITLSHLEKGMYLVNIVSKTGITATHKVIIK